MNDKLKHEERRNREADEARKEFERSGKGVSHDDMRKWLESWGKGNEKSPPPCGEDAKT